MTRRAWPWTIGSCHGRQPSDSRLAQPFDATVLRRIKRLWVRHSIAEDARDVEGLVRTLAPDCVYEIVSTGQRWHGHAGARDFYTELFGAFPDNVFALDEIVIGPQGVFEVATLTATNAGAWAGVPPSGPPVRLSVLIFFPWDPRGRTLCRRADLAPRPRRQLTVARGPGDSLSDRRCPARVARSPPRRRAAAPPRP